MQISCPKTVRLENQLDLFGSNGNKALIFEGVFFKFYWLNQASFFLMARME